jgi:hypothetical protein
MESDALTIHDLIEVESIQPTQLEHWIEHPASQEGSATATILSPSPSETKC